MKLTKTLVAAMLVGLSSWACIAGISLGDPLLDRLAETAEAGIRATSVAYLREAVDGQVQEFESYLEETGIASVEQLSVGEVIMLYRAWEWYRDGVKYGSYDGVGDNDSYQGWRADCSGFVSYVWQLDRSITTDQFLPLGYASPLFSLQDVQLGDVFNNNQPGESGHVIMFISWASEGQYSSFWGVDLSGPGAAGKVEFRKFTLITNGDGWSIPERGLEAGAYYPQTKN